METLIDIIEKNIQILQNLKSTYSTKEGWVVESEDYINVGDGNGLNGTAFAVKCPQADTEAQIWDTEELAEKYGADYYLVDGDNKPVQMRFTKACYFFDREIKIYKNLLENIES